jgi:hypothetical protein
MPYSKNDINTRDLDYIKKFHVFYRVQKYRYLKVTPCIHITYVMFYATIETTTTNMYLKTHSCIRLASSARHKSGGISRQQATPCGAVLHTGHTLITLCTHKACVTRAQKESTKSIRYALKEIHVTIR